MTESNYIKVTEGIYVAKAATPEVINLADKKAELVQLQAIKEMQEPTDQEFFELGRAMHPYYRAQTEVEQKILQLQEIITELEAL